MTGKLSTDQNRAKASDAARQALQRPSQHFDWDDAIARVREILDELDRTGHEPGL